MRPSFIEDRLKGRGRDAEASQDGFSVLVIACEGSERATWHTYCYAIIEAAQRRVAAEISPLDVGTGQIKFDALYAPALPKLDNAEKRGISSRIDSSICDKDGHGNGGDNGVFAAGSLHVEKPDQLTFTDDGTSVVWESGGPAHIELADVAEQSGTGFDRARLAGSRPGIARVKIVLLHVFSRGRIAGAPEQGESEDSGREGGLHTSHHSTYDALVAVLFRAYLRALRLRAACIFLNAARRFGVQWGPVNLVLRVAGLRAAVLRLAVVVFRAAGLRVVRRLVVVVFRAAGLRVVRRLVVAVFRAAGLRVVRRLVVVVFRAAGLRLTVFLATGLRLGAAFRAAGLRLTVFLAAGLRLGAAFRAVGLRLVATVFRAAGLRLTVFLATGLRLEAAFRAVGLRLTVFFVTGLRLGAAFRAACFLLTGLRFGGAFPMAAAKTEQGAAFLALARLLVAFRPLVFLAGALLPAAPRIASEGVMVV